MASLAQQLAGGLRCPPLSNSNLSKPFSPKHTLKPRFSPIVSAVAVSNAQTRERQKLKQLFEDAYERCRNAPMEGVSFTIDDFHTALDKYDFNSEMGSRVILIFLLLLQVFLMDFWVIMLVLCDGYFYLFMILIMYVLRLFIL